MEHSSALRGELARTSGALDELDQSRHRLATLLGSRPMQVCHPGQGRTAEPATELDEHRGPAVKQRALPCVAWGPTRAVSVEPLEIEESRTESQEPAPDGVCHDATMLRDTPQGNSVRHRLSDRIENDLDAGDLAGQRIEGQYALAVSATAAARQRYGERDERVACLEPALDPTASKLEINSATTSTTTAGEDLVACAVDDRGVVATLDVEYENHVLMTAPG